MPLAKEDGSSDAAASLTDIEGRMLVLEVVAMTSLAMALNTSDPEDADVGRGVLYLIREAVNNKCDEMRLSSQATSTAQTYVDELVHTAMHSLFPKQH